MKLSGRASRGLGCASERVRCANTGDELDHDCGQAGTRFAGRGRRSGSGGRIATACAAAAAVLAFPGGRRAWARRRPHPFHHHADAGGASPRRRVSGPGRGDGADLAAQSSVHVRAQRPQTARGGIALCRGDGGGAVHELRRLCAARFDHARRLAARRRCRV